MKDKAKRCFHIMVGLKIYSTKITPNFSFPDGILLLESITIRFRLFRFNYVKQILSWKPDFKKIQKELRDKNENLSILHGYPNIYTMIDRILVLMEKMAIWRESQEETISYYENFLLEENQ